MARMETLRDRQMEAAAYKLAGTFCPHWGDESIADNAQDWNESGWTIDLPAPGTGNWVRSEGVYFTAEELRRIVEQAEQIFAAAV